MHIAYSRFFGSMIYFTLFFNFIFLFDGVIVFSAKFKFLGFFFYYSREVLLVCNWFRMPYILL